MPGFNSIEEYTAYANDLSSQELMQVASNIDRTSYPDRYEVLKTIIQERLGVDIEEPDRLNLEFKYYKSIVFYQAAYLIILLIHILGLVIIALAPESGVLADKSFPDILLGLAVSSAIYYGLRSIKSWIIILILINAYWSLVQHLLELSTPVNNMMEFIVVRGMWILGLLFYGYMVYVFSKPETKQFFGHKGKALIV